jgi:predicted GNAT family N-acyltransferase
MEYALTVALRDRVLRAPLGLAFPAAELAAEAAQWHLALWQGERLLACLVLVPLSGGEVKMRQVAVEPAWQGRGLGRRLVEEAERLARERGCTRMTLHARATAVAVYLHLGYESVGAPFTEVTIPHQAMRKALG